MTCPSFDTRVASVIAGPSEKRSASALAASRAVRPRECSESVSKSGKMSCAWVGRSFDGWCMALCHRPFRSAQLCPHAHQDQADDVQSMARAQIDAPLTVIRGVAVDQRAIARGQQTRRERWVLSKLRSDEDDHHIALDLLPVGAERQAPAHSSSLV